MFGWCNSPTLPDVQDDIALMEEPDTDDRFEDDWSREIDALNLFKAKGETGSIAPACDQVAVEKEADNWAKLWRTQQAYDDPFADRKFRDRAKCEASRLPRLIVQEI